MFPYLSLAVTLPSLWNLIRSTDFVVAICDCSDSIAGAAIAVVDSNPNRFRNCFLFI
jgi:hypothetical protein